MTDKLELLLLSLISQLFDLELYSVIDSLESLLTHHIREQRRLNRSLPVDKKRVTWSNFVSKISDQHFRRMFRMDATVFSKLCTVICEKVTEEEFRPEAYILEKKGNDEDQLKLIPGEVKVALSIRLMAGGSYLDLVPLFAVSKSHLYNAFTCFVQWI